MPKAFLYSNKISSFPFVEGVFLSGAISKNYYDEHGDIDYFIITKPNRLWICRTLLIIRYKLLPKSKKKFWCVNYFIGSNNLEIPEENLFVATEIAYLVPTINYDLYTKFLRANVWFKKHYPNKNEHSNKQCNALPKNFLKVLIEKILSGFLGDVLDNFLLKITLKHWQKKYPTLSTIDFELQFRSQKNVCKRHTTGYQNIVMDNYLNKQIIFEKEHNVILQH